MSTKRRHTEDEPPPVVSKKLKKLLAKLGMDDDAQSDGEEPFEVRTRYSRSNLSSNPASC